MSETTILLTYTTAVQVTVTISRIVGLLFEPIIPKMGYRNESVF